MRILDQYWLIGKEGADLISRGRLWIFRGSQQFQGLADVIRNKVLTERKYLSKKVEMAGSSLNRTLCPKIV